MRGWISSIVIVAGLVLVGACGDDDRPRGGDGGVIGVDGGGGGDTDSGPGTCAEPCSATDTCFPRTASCICMGGASVEFDNCVDGCCFEGSLMEACDLACAM